MVSYSQLFHEVLWIISENYLESFHALTSAYLLMIPPLMMLEGIVAYGCIATLILHYWKSTLVYCLSCLHCIIPLFYQEATDACILPMHQLWTGSGLSRFFDRDHTNVLSFASLSLAEPFIHLSLGKVSEKPLTLVWGVNPTRWEVSLLIIQPV